MEAKLTLVMLAQLSISCGLTALIWFVQLVHYPMFEFLDDENFSIAMKFHQDTISYVVIPLMILELALTAYQLYTSATLSFVIAAIVLCIWVSTFLLQVPLHKKLSYGKDRFTISSLVRTNWVRTTLWSLKLVLLLYSLSMV